MPRYKCVKKCFWGNVLWSPNADGQQIYERAKIPPKSKQGEEYFELLEETVVMAVRENQSKPVITFREPVTTSGELARWELNQMPKIELQAMLLNKFGVSVDNEVIKKDLMQMILDAQKKHKPTSQEVANTELR